MILQVMLWIAGYKARCSACHRSAMPASSRQSHRQCSRPPTPTRRSSRPTNAPSTSKPSPQYFSEWPTCTYSLQTSFVPASGPPVRKMRAGDAVVRSAIERRLQLGHTGVRAAPGARPQTLPRQRTRNRRTCE